MSPAGLFDKAALESMACGVPTVVCNPAFAPLLGEYAELLLVKGPDDARGLSERLARLFALSAAERTAIGAAPAFKCAARAQSAGDGSAADRGIAHGRIAKDGITTVPPVHAMSAWASRGSPLQTA